MTPDEAAREIEEMLAVEQRALDRMCATWPGATANIEQQQGRVAALTVALDALRRLATVRAAVEEKRQRLQRAANLGDHVAAGQVLALEYVLRLLGEPTHE